MFRRQNKEAEVATVPLPESLFAAARNGDAIPNRFSFYKATSPTPSIRSRSNQQTPKHKNGRKIITSNRSQAKQRIVDAIGPSCQASTGLLEHFQARDTDTQSTAHSTKPDSETSFHCSAFDQVLQSSYSHTSGSLNGTTGESTSYDESPTYESPDLTSASEDSLGNTDGSKLSITFEENTFDKDDEGDADDDRTADEDIHFLNTLNTLDVAEMNQEEEGRDVLSTDTDEFQSKDGDDGICVTRSAPTETDQEEDGRDVLSTDSDEFQSKDGDHGIFVVRSAPTDWTAHTHTSLLDLEPTESNVYDDGKPLAPPESIEIGKRGSIKSSIRDSLNSEPADLKASLRSPHEMVEAIRPVQNQQSFSQDRFYFEEGTCEEKTDGSILSRESDGDTGTIEEIDDSQIIAIFDSNDMSMAFPSNSFAEEEEEISVPVTRVSRIPYVHGAFASAAPLMLKDYKWMRILQRLMPDAHADAIVMLRRDHEASRGKRSFLQPAKIMKWAENNPIVAAFGVHKHFSDDSSLNGKPPSVPVLEWDVFLDPTLVKAVDFAMKVSEAHEKNNDDIEISMAAEIEVDRQIGRLLKRMVLAHGSTSQLAAEALGIGPRYTFASLVEQGLPVQMMHKSRPDELTWAGKDIRGDNGKTASTASIFLERWLFLFASALQQVKAEALPAAPFNGGELNSSSIDYEDASGNNPLFCSALLCFGYDDPTSRKAVHGKTSMRKSAKLIEELLGNPLRVVLDLKSRRVPPKIWARLIANIRSRGVIVDGIGSFDFKELREIGNFCMPKVKEIRFFHSAGDLQKACHANEVKFGDTVYFNAGSLVRWDRKRHMIVFEPFAYPSAAVPNVFAGEPQCMATIQDYKKRFNLDIGCYIQEFSVSETNLDALVRFLNKNAIVYNLGLAWGGLNGLTPRGLEGDGYWNQRYMGTSWDLKAEPTIEMTMLHPDGHHLVQDVINKHPEWGYIGTVNNVGEDVVEATALQLSNCHHD